jgi:hypothetical protein
VKSWLALPFACALSRLSLETTTMLLTIMSFRLEVDRLCLTIRLGRWQFDVMRETGPIPAFPWVEHSRRGEVILDLPGVALIFTNMKRFVTCTTTVDI